MTVHNIHVSHIEAFLSYRHPLVQCCPDNRDFTVLQLGKSKWETTISNYLQNPLSLFKVLFVYTLSGRCQVCRFYIIVLSVITSACSLSYSNLSIKNYSTVCKQAFAKCQNHFHIVHIKMVMVKITNTFLKYTDIHGKSTLLQVHPLFLPSLVLNSLKISVELWLSLYTGHWVVETVLISTSSTLPAMLPQTPNGGPLNITSSSVTIAGFMADYEYNITVRGVNCECLEGNESEPLTITPQGLY